MGYYIVKKCKGTNPKPIGYGSLHVSIGSIQFLIQPEIQMTKKVYVKADGTPATLADASSIVGIRFTFDDHTEDKPSQQVFEIAKANDETKLRALFHGFSQKIGDSYASASGSNDPLAFAKAAVKDTIEQLYAGDWRATSAAGPRTTDLAIALSRLTGKGLDESVAFTDSLSDEEKKAWRAKGKVKAMLAQLAAEKAVERANKLAKSAGVAPKEGEEEEDISFESAPKGSEEETV